MKKLSISNPGFEIDLQNGFLSGQKVRSVERLIRDLKLFFGDENARAAMPQNELIYEVQSIQPVDEGTVGGLFFGRTIIHPGRVGSEYFMTKGHFHKKSNRGEYYWGLKGEGMLILMDRNHHVWAEKMYPGSLHYIPGHIAHRIANISDEPLIFEACWPSDAGHDYDRILYEGFSARLMEIDDMPRLVPEKN